VSALLLSFLFSLKKEPPNAERYVGVGDFPSGHVWFNTAGPLSLYSQLEGHVLVVIFCDFSRLSDALALEGLQSLQDSLRRQPVQFIVAYVPVEETLTAWRQTVRDWGVDFPVIVDHDGAVRSNFGVDSIPQVLLLDAHSRIVTRYSCGWQNADIEGLVADLLAEGVASRSLSFNRFMPQPGEFVPPGFDGRR